MFVWKGFSSQCRNVKWSFNVSVVTWIQSYLNVYSSINKEKHAPDQNHVYVSWRFGVFHNLISRTFLYYFRNIVTVLLCLDIQLCLYSGTLDFNNRYRGATLNWVGGRGGWLVNQSWGGVWKHFFSVILYNFQKGGGLKHPSPSSSTEPVCKPDKSKLPNGQ